MRPRGKEESLEGFARHNLLERRRSLMERHARAEQSAQELLDEREPDWEDRAANVSAANGLTSLADDERAQLARVTAALERLDDGTWGWCVRCGAPIAESRLRAVPEASRCAGCQDHQ